MSNVQRWRLGCHPTAEGCQFVVTNKGNLAKALRFDCAVHHGGFMVTPRRKNGVLLFESVDEIGEPARKPGIAESL